MWQRNAEESREAEQSARGLMQELSWEMKIKCNSGSGGSSEVSRELWKGFPHSLVGKESACNAGDQGSIPGSGRSPGEWNGNRLQYSCLENPMDRGAWQATVHGVARVGYDLATKEKENNS